MKISGIQLFWLFASYEFGMTALLTISPTIGIAKQDAWISFLIACVLTVVITFIATKVSLLYPSQTLIEYSQTILGKWIGKIIIIPYLIMWYSVSGIILRESSDFIIISMFDRTPLAAVAILMLVVIIYAAYNGGIEGIARCSELMGPVIFTTIGIMLLLSLANIHFNFLLPIYVDTKWQSIVKASVNPLGFLGESIMIMMLVPFAAIKEKVLSRVLSGVTVACIFSFIITLMVIMTYGPNLPAKMWYPFLNMVRFISVARFIENVDTVIVVGWLLSVFIKLSLYLFIASYGTAQWLHIKNWRHVIWVAAPIIFVLSMVYPNIDLSSINYPQKFWNPFIVPVDMFAIPILLWIVGSIRKKQSIS